MKHHFILAAMAACALACPRVSGASERGALYQIVGNGKTTGTACVVVSQSGAKLDEWQPGHVFRAFNTLRDEITVNCRGRVGKIPRSAAVQLSASESALHRQQMNAEAAEREQRLFGARIREVQATAERQATRQQTAPRMQNTQQGSAGAMAARR